MSSFLLLTANQTDNKERWGNQQQLDCQGGLRRIGGNKSRGYIIQGVRARGVKINSPGGGLFPFF
jgi:hypothetical protein